MATQSRFVIIVALSVFIFQISAFAEVTEPFDSTPPIAPQQPVEPDDHDGEYEVALAPVAIIIGIFARAALQVGKRQIQKAFTERAARTAVASIRAGRFRKVTDSICYSVEAAGRTRVILAPDKKTILFAGSHEAYNKFFSTRTFTSACRGKRTASWFAEPQWLNKFHSPS